jgi:hypothetical protein
MPTYHGRNRKDVLGRRIREAIVEENRKEIIERSAKAGRNGYGGVSSRVEPFPTGSGETGSGSRPTRRKRRSSR